MTARVSLPFHVFPQDCWLVPGGWCLFFMLCGPLAMGEEVSGQTGSSPADIEFDSRLLDSLGARTRAIFLLAQIEELSYVDISQRLGVSLPTVKKHLVRAYTDSVAQALLQAGKTAIVRQRTLRCTVPYAMEGMLRRELDGAGATLLNVAHGDAVLFDFSLPETAATALLALTENEDDVPQVVVAAQEFTTGALAHAQRHGMGKLVPNRQFQQQRQRGVQ